MKPSGVMGFKIVSKKQNKIVSMKTNIKVWHKPIIKIYSNS